MLNPAELHRHLDGSLRPTTVQELARRRKLEIPQPLEFHTGMGLQAALDRFRFTLQLLRDPDPVRRVADEMCQDARNEGLSALEIRFAPQLHLGADPATILDAALEGAAGRATFILCGLYGESPDALASLVELARTRPRVVGLDLAGGPTGAHDFSMLDYRDVFREAGAVGLGRTVHAGEGRPPAEIGVAIEHLKAERIGHATTILESPEVVSLALEHGVTLEACITSNLQTKAIGALEEHPLPRWLDAGLDAVVCTDNTLFSATTLSRELELAAALPGMSRAKVNRVVEQSNRALFQRPNMD